MRVGKSLAWLNSKKVKEAKGLEKGSSGKSSLSSRGGGGGIGKRLEKGTVAETGYLSWEESKKILEKVAVGETDRSWEDLAEAVK